MNEPIVISAKFGDARDHRVMVAATRAGVVLHRDVIDVRYAADRERFVSDVMKAAFQSAEQQLHAQLMQLIEWPVFVNRHAGETEGGACR